MPHRGEAGRDELLLGLLVPRVAGDQDPTHSCGVRRVHFPWKHR